MREVDKTDRRSEAEVGRPVASYDSLSERVVNLLLAQPLNPLCPAKFSVLPNPPHLVRNEC